MALQQVTLQQLHETLRGQTDNAAYWTASELTAGVNEALRLWNLMTGTWRTRRHLTVPAGVYLISTKSVMWMPVRLEWQGRLVEKTSRYDLSCGRPGWQRETGARPRQWAPAGLDKVVLWPHLAATDTGSLIVEGVLDTPVLRKLEDYVQIGREDLRALIDYTLHYLAFKEGGVRFASTEPRFQAYQVAAQSKNSRIKAATLFRRPTGQDLERTQRPTHRATLPGVEATEE